jgi:hypothetical protein
MGIIGNSNVTSWSAGTSSEASEKAISSSKRVYRS